jgi:hypothetical protein
MKFLRHLLGVTKLGKKMNQCIRKKTEEENIVNGIKTVPRKVSTTHIEDGHKQVT